MNPRKRNLVLFFAQIFLGCIVGYLSSQTLILFVHLVRDIKKYYFKKELIQTTNLNQNISLPFEKETLESTSELSTEAILKTASDTVSPEVVFYIFLGSFLLLTTFLVVNSFSNSSLSSSGDNLFPWVLKDSSCNFTNVFCFPESIITKFQTNEICTWVEFFYFLF